MIYTCFRICNSNKLLARKVSSLRAWELTHYPSHYHFNDGSGMDGHSSSFNQMKQKLAMRWQQWGPKRKSSFGFWDNWIHKRASIVVVTSNCNLLFKKRLSLDKCFKIAPSPMYTVHNSSTLCFFSTLSTSFLQSLTLDSSLFNQKFFFGLLSEMGQVYIYCHWLILVWNHERFVEFLHCFEIWLCLQKESIVHPFCLNSGTFEAPAM